jgi:EmrB/QacA subfamily drug resistance transporter
MTDRHARNTLAISGLAVLVTFLDTTVLFVAFPDISRTFAAAGPAQLSWVLNAYTIAFAALLVPAGKVADRIGHKRVFLFGSALFTTASLACAVAPTVDTLIAFRVVQAVGAAALIPSSLALVMRAYSRDRLPVAVAIWGAMGAAAGAVGPTLGAVLIEAGSWRWVFVINVPAGLVIAVVGRKVLRESTDEATRIPAAAGVVLIAGAAALSSLAVVQSNDWGWFDGRTTSVLVAAAVLLTAFVLHQQRTEAPVMDLELLGIRNFAWANISMFAFGIAFSAMFLSNFLFMTQVWGYSLIGTGLGVTPGPLLVAILAPRFGKVAGRIGQRPLIIAGGVVYAVAGVWRLVLLDAEPAYWSAFFPSMVLTGLGVALCIPQLSSTIAQSLPANRAGVGGAVHQAIRQFGGTLGVAFTIALIARPQSPSDALARFDRVWVLLVIGGLLTSAAALRLATRRDPAHPQAMLDAMRRSSAVSLRSSGEEAPLSAPA